MDDRTRQRTDDLHEIDFYSWTQQQAALLKEGRIASADIGNIVEELETLGRSELGALVSAYKLVTQHLLKLTYQPDKATLSWKTTIERERGKIQDLIDDNPGLKPKRDEAFAKGYARGRRDASNETGIAIGRFPAMPPFTRDQAETGELPSPPLPEDKPPSRG